MMRRNVPMLILTAVLLAACSPATITPTETTEPPVSEPPVFEPPVSEPPVSEPPVSEPPASPTATEPAGPETGAPQAGLEGTAWNLVSMGPVGEPTPIIEGSTVTLQFSEGGQVGGNGGCNSFSGPYQVEGDQITFGELVSTLMACADQAVTEQEATYLNALQTAERFELSGESLVIFYHDGQSALTFEPGTAVQN